jgi:hypothetical protein
MISKGVKMILMPRQHWVKQETPGWHLNLNWLLYPRRTGEMQAVLSASFMDGPFMGVRSFCRF